MYLIVGAGLSGVVIANRIAEVLKEKVVIIDRRSHIAGNIYDYRDENGIMIHKYGPHAFHTNDSEVWKYLSKFTDWWHYSHRVKAIVEGKAVPVPFNIDSIYSLFSTRYSEELIEALINAYGVSNKIPILDLLKSDNQKLKNLADYIYNHVFLGYTAKQWGNSPEDVDRSVMSRVPVNISRDDRYFQDTYQGIPSNGYTSMIEKMLDNDLIEVKLNVDYKNYDKSGVKHIFYSGMIDEYYDFKFGKLPYRSLRFEVKNYSFEKYFNVAQMNYPNNYDFTRITEFKHFLPTKSSTTTVAYEYPEEFVYMKNEPYYPIPGDENAALYKQYFELSKENENITFIGRLGCYKYFNMDQIVRSSLDLIEDFFNESR